MCVSSPFIFGFPLIYSICPTVLLNIVIIVILFIDVGGRNLDCSESCTPLREERKANGSKRGRRRPLFFQLLEPDVTVQELQWVTSINRKGVNGNRSLDQVGSCRGYWNDSPTIDIVAFNCLEVW